jgi:hypothetical protein
MEAQAREVGQCEAFEVFRLTLVTLFRFYLNQHFHFVT